MDTFVVRFSERFYFVRLTDQGEPQGAFFPTQATFMSFSCGVQVVKALRQLGFLDAVVATPKGLPCLPEDCNEDSPAEEFEKVWGSPLVNALPAE
jgi:hypothetical protein